MNTKEQPRWKFFELEGDRETVFEVSADNHEDAYEKAFEMWGPQIYDLYCQEIKTELKP
jgi:hypothetical protein